jgi:hypothetical protein
MTTRDSAAHIGDRRTEPAVIVRNIQSPLQCYLDRRIQPHNRDGLAKLSRSLMRSCSMRIAVNCIVPLMVIAFARADDRLADFEPQSTSFERK